MLLWIKRKNWFPWWAGSNDFTGSLFFLCLLCRPRIKAVLRHLMGGSYDKIFRCCEAPLKKKAEDIIEAAREKFEQLAVTPTFQFSPEACFLWNLCCYIYRSLKLTAEGRLLFSCVHRASLSLSWMYGVKEKFPATDVLDSSFETARNQSQQM